MKKKRSVFFIQNFMWQFTALPTPQHTTDGPFREVMLFSIKETLGCGALEKSIVPPTQTPTPTPTTTVFEDVGEQVFSDTKQIVGLVFVSMLLVVGAVSASNNGKGVVFVVGNNEGVVFAVENNEGVVFAVENSKDEDDGGNESSPFSPPHSSQRLWQSAQ